MYLIENFHVFRHIGTRKSSYAFFSLFHQAEEIRFTPLIISIEMDYHFPAVNDTINCVLCYSMTLLLWVLSFAYPPFLPSFDSSQLICFLFPRLCFALYILQ